MRVGGVVLDPNYCKRLWIGLLLCVALVAIVIR